VRAFHDCLRDKILRPIGVTGGLSDVSRGRLVDDIDAAVDALL